MNQCLSHHLCLTRLKVRYFCNHRSSIAPQALKQWSSFLRRRARQCALQTSMEFVLIYIYIYIHTHMFMYIIPPSASAVGGSGGVSWELGFCESLISATTSANFCEQAADLVKVGSLRLLQKWSLASLLTPFPSTPPPVPCLPSGYLWVPSGCLWALCGDPGRLLRASW